METLVGVCRVTSSEEFKVLYGVREVFSCSNDSVYHPRLTHTYRECGTGVHCRKSIYMWIESSRSGVTGRMPKDG